MLTILAIDASTTTCSVACLIGSKIYGELSQAKGEHNKIISAMIKTVISKADIAFKDIDYLAVTMGPGSFTGVRLGISVVQGLAFGLNIPVIPISTLELLGYQAYSITSDTPVIVGLDARMGEIYWATFKKDAESDFGFSYCITDSLSSFEKISIDTNHFCYGDVWGNSLANKRDNFSLFIAENQFPQANYLAEFAKLKTGTAINYLDLTPVYIRNNIVRL